MRGLDDDFQTALEPPRIVTGITSEELSQIAARCRSLSEQAAALVVDPESGQVVAEGASLGLLAEGCHHAPLSALAHAAAQGVCTRGLHLIASEVPCAACSAVIQRAAFGKTAVLVLGEELALLPLF